MSNLKIEVTKILEAGKCNFGHKKGDTFDVTERRHNTIIRGGPMKCTSSSYNLTNAIDREKQERIFKNKDFRFRKKEL